MFRKFLVYPLFNLLVLIYALLPGHDFGLAVVILTILVRLALWPLVDKQLHSQRALQRLAPEAAKVRAKAAGDKQKESLMLMELYKERGVSPFSSLLPLFIQLPILIALFIMIRDIVQPGEIARLTYEPIRQLSFVRDLISGSVQFKPSLLGLIDMAKPHWFLAATAGATQFLQARQLQPSHPEGKQDPQARAMATTTLIFPFITVFIAFTLPSALALFWTVTSLVAILQQHLVLRRDAHELQEPAPVPKTSKKKKRKSPRSRA